MHQGEVTNATGTSGSSGSGRNKRASCTELSEVGSTKGETGTELGIEFSKVGAVNTCTIYWEGC